MAALFYKGQQQHHSASTSPSPLRMTTPHSEETSLRNLLSVSLPFWSPASVSIRRGGRSVHLASVAPMCGVIVASSPLGQSSFLQLHGEQLDLTKRWLRGGFFLFVGFLHIAYVDEKTRKEIFHPAVSGAGRVFNNLP